MEGSRHRSRIGDVREDDAALVTAIRGGSRRAWDALVARHGAAAWRVANAIVGRRAVADEVVQEAFADVVRSLDSFDATRPFRPWLLRIVVCRALDAVRAERRFVLAAEVAVADTSGAAEVDRREEDVMRIVAGLSAEQRALLALRFWCDLTEADVAAVLGVPVGTVWSRLSRTLERIRAHLEVGGG